MVLAPWPRPRLYARSMTRGTSRKERARLPIRAAVAVCTAALLSVGTLPFPSLASVGRAGTDVAGDVMLSINSYPGGALSGHGYLDNTGFGLAQLPIDVQITVHRVATDVDVPEGGCPRRSGGSLIGSAVLTKTTDPDTGASFVAYTTTQGTAWYYLHVTGTTWGEKCSRPVPVTLQPIDTFLPTSVGPVVVGQRTTLDANAVDTAHFQVAPGTTTVRLNNDVIGRTTVGPLWEDWATVIPTYPWSTPVTWRPARVGTVELEIRYSGSPVTRPSQKTLRVKVGKHPTKITTFRAPSRGIVRGKRAVVAIALTGKEYTKGGRVTLLFGGRVLKQIKVKRRTAQLVLSARATKRLPRGMIRLRAEYAGTKSATGARATTTVKVR